MDHPWVYELEKWNQTVDHFNQGSQELDGTLSDTIISILCVLDQARNVLYGRPIQDIPLSILYPIEHTLQNVAILQQRKLDMEQVQESLKETNIGGLFPTTASQGKREEEEKARQLALQERLKKKRKTENLEVLQTFAPPTKASFATTMPAMMMNVAEFLATGEWQAAFTHTTKGMSIREVDLWLSELEKEKPCQLNRTDNVYDIVLGFVRHNNQFELVTIGDFQFAKTIITETEFEVWRQSSIDIQGWSSKIALGKDLSDEEKAVRDRITKDKNFGQILGPWPAYGPTQFYLFSGPVMLRTVGTVFRAFFPIASIKKLEPTKEEEEKEREEKKEPMIRMGTEKLIDLEFVPQDVEKQTPLDRMVVRGELTTRATILLGPFDRFLKLDQFIGSGKAPILFTPIVRERLFVHSQEMARERDAQNPSFVGGIAYALGWIGITETQNEKFQMHTLIGMYQFLSIARLRKVLPALGVTIGDLLSDEFAYYAHVPKWIQINQVYEDRLKRTRCTEDDYPTTIWQHMIVDDYPPFRSHMITLLNNTRNLNFMATIPFAPDLCEMVVDREINTMTAFTDEFDQELNEYVRGLEDLFNRLDMRPKYSFQEQRPIACFYNKALKMCVKRLGLGSGATWTNVMTVARAMWLYYLVPHRYGDYSKELSLLTLPTPKKRRDAALGFMADAYVHLLTKDRIPALSILSWTTGARDAWFAKGYDWFGKDGKCVIDPRLDTVWLQTKPPNPRTLPLTTLEGTEWDISFDENVAHHVVNNIEIQNRAFESKTSVAHAFHLEMHVLVSCKKNHEMWLNRFSTQTRLIFLPILLRMWYYAAFHDHAKNVPHDFHDPLEKRLNILAAPKEPPETAKNPESYVQYLQFVHNMYRDDVAAYYMWKERNGEKRLQPLLQIEDQDNDVPAETSEGKENENLQSTKEKQTRMTLQHEFLIQFISAMTGMIQTYINKNLAGYDKSEFILRHIAIDSPVRWTSVERGHHSSEAWYVRILLFWLHCITNAELYSVLRVFHILFLRTNYEAWDMFLSEVFRRGLGIKMHDMAPEAEDMDEFDGICLLLFLGMDKMSDWKDMAWNESDGWIEWNVKTGMRQILHKRLTHSLDAEIGNLQAELETQVKNLDLNLKYLLQNDHNEYAGVREWLAIPHIHKNLPNRMEIMRSHPNMMAFFLFGMDMAGRPLYRPVQWASVLKLFKRQAEGKYPDPEYIRVPPHVLVQLPPHSLDTIFQDVESANDVYAEIMEELKERVENKANPNLREEMLIDDVYSDSWFDHPWNASLSDDLSAEQNRRKIKKMSILQSESSVPESKEYSGYHWHDMDADQARLDELKTKRHLTTVDALIQQVDDASSLSFAREKMTFEEKTFIIRDAREKFWTAVLDVLGEDMSDHTDQWRSLKTWFKRPFEGTESDRYMLAGFEAMGKNMPPLVPIHPTPSGPDPRSVPIWGNPIPEFPLARFSPEWEAAFEKQSKRYYEWQDRGADEFYF